LLEKKLSDDLQAICARYRVTVDDLQGACMQEKLWRWRKSSGNRLRIAWTITELLIDNFLSYQIIDILPLNHAVISA